VTVVTGDGGTPYRLASRTARPHGTVVSVGDVRVGGDEVIVMAGPCAVESEAQIRAAAAAVKRAGAKVLRGGAFKPRSSPYSFQGLGEEALRLLRWAADEHTLVTVSEVMDVSQVETAARYCDLLQVGARNMQNFTLLRELGQLRKPVLLKRGISATIEEWLLSAEYVLAGGNPDVILCERGIRTFENSTRNTLDISAIPVVKSLSHLPIIADPSHGTGLRDKVAPMARAAVAAGADGLIIEVHCDPDHALSDGPQSLHPAQFDRLMAELRIIAPAIGRGICVDPPSRRGWSR
jgi:3-deoxy-7-phosphoheptulonate synthase